MSILHGSMIGPMGSSMVGGTRPASGGAEPETGTVILGEASVSTGRSINGSYGDANAMYFTDVTLTASWAESAETCAISKMHGFYVGKSAGAIKFALYSAAGSLIAVSNQIVTAWEADGSEAEWYASFSSPPTITKGTSYLVGFILSVAYGVNFAIHSSSGATVYRNTSATFASPPSSIASGNTNHQSDYKFDIWGTA